MRYRYPRWWNKTLTIYHRQEKQDENERTHVEWIRSIIKNCFSGTKAKQTVSGNEILPVNINVVRVPHFVDVSPGDIIVLADTENDTALTSELAIKKKYPNSFAVEEVHDNTKAGFSPHVYISG